MSLPANQRPGSSALPLMAPQAPSRRKLWRAPGTKHRHRHRQPASNRRPHTSPERARARTQRRPQHYHPYPTKSGQGRRTTQPQPPRPATMGFSRKPDRRLKISARCAPGCVLEWWGPSLKSSQPPRFYRPRRRWPQARSRSSRRASESLMESLMQPGPAQRSHRRPKPCPPRCRPPIRFFTQRRRSLSYWVPRRRSWRARGSSRFPRPPLESCQLHHARELASNGATSGCS